MRQLRGEAGGFKQLVPEAPDCHLDPVRDDPGPASSDTPSTEEDCQGVSIDGGSRTRKYPRSQPGPIGWFADHHEAPGCEGWRQGDEVGVLQGAVEAAHGVGVLMDSLNDMVDLPPGIKLLGYADDLVVYNTNGRLGHGGANSVMQRVMDRLHDAITELGLKAVYFHGRRPKGTLQLKLDGVAIDWVDEFKYLGVVLDRGKTTQNPSKPFQNYPKPSPPPHP